VNFPPKSSPAKKSSPASKSARKSSRSPTRSPTRRQASPTRSSPLRSTANIFLTPQSPRELCLFRQPIETIKHFSLASFETFGAILNYLSEEPMKVVSSLALVILVVLIDQLEGPHQKQWKESKELISWLLLWFFRGFLSCLSIGPQANSFPMYLGPFVAQVTTTAFFCKSLSFLLFGKEAFKCSSTAKRTLEIALGSIFAKIVWPVIFFGFGLILGQFPLYYLAMITGNALESLGKSRPFYFASFEKLSYRAKYFIFLLTSLVSIFHSNFLF
jgi:uncharacterized membrane protein YccF (DUF307 family)